MGKFSVRIVKKEPMAWYYNLAIRAAAVIIALLVSAVVIMLLTGKNPIEVYSSMISGADSTCCR